MRIETNSRMLLIFFLGITLISIQLSFVEAAAEFRDGTLILPYVLVDEELYSVELVLADNRDPWSLVSDRTTVMPTQHPHRLTRPSLRVTC